MSPSSTLGLAIPNANYIFSCTKSTCIDDYLFIFTKENELIVYSKQEDKINNVSLLKQKFILMTQMQNREEIIDVFIMDSNHLILSPNSKLILTISKRCIIHYFNLVDGLCINKLNLSSFMDHTDEIVQISEISKRFLIIIFRRKAILFDSFANIVIKEEEMKVLIPSKELLEIGQDQKKEGQDANDNSYYYHYQKRDRDREKVQVKAKAKKRDEYDIFQIEKIYQVKDNSFFIKCKVGNTYFLQVTNIKAIDKTSIDYEDMRIKIIKQTFQIEKFFKNETLHTMYSNQDYIFHNISQVIKLSFLDSVEELTEVTKYKTKAKFPIKFMSSIRINNEEFLLVLYTDFKCELFTYDKKFREIKKYKEFVLMVEDELFNMDFVTSDNALIGYNELNVNLFDLRRYVKNNEKYADKDINLKDIFNRYGNNLFFTNYFNSNFPSYINEIASQFTSLNSNGNYTITTSILFAYCEHKSIYYIFGTDTGKVGILDVFFTENLNLNPILIIDYHQTPIETLSIYDNRTLITSSKDGMISFTDISLQKLEAIINKTTIEKREYIDDLNLSNLKKNHSKIRKDTIDYYTQLFNYSYIRRKTMESHRKPSQKDLNEKLNAVTLIPSHNIKNFYRLRRIMSVVKLDRNIATSNEEEKKKSNSLIALDLENNDVIVIRMDNFASLYRFNQGTSDISIKAIYHISSQKSFIFYLNNNTVKISSYSTRTCDRYITDLDKIYKILRVDEQLKLYFNNQNNVNDYVSNMTKQSLWFDEIQAEKNKAKNKERGGRNLISLRQDLYNNITIQNIKEVITDPLEKEIFTLKLWNNSHLNKQYLNMTSSKFEAIWMKKIEHWIIDEIIGIINHPEASDQLKKIQIMNLLYNPQTFLKMQDKYDNNNNGICGNYMRIGQQYNEFLMINYEDYFIYLEKTIHEQKDIKCVFRTNYFNFLSLFHIWNFVLTSDMLLYEQFKIFQPIFDFFPILIGFDSACSLLLIEEEHIDLIINSSPFKQHYNYFIQELKINPNSRFQVNSNSNKSKSITNEKEGHNNNIISNSNNINSNNNDQRNLFSNKSILFENYQGYLVNLKNYKQSPNLSHHLHLALFGGLIAMLGFEDNAQLCKFIEKDKNILRILSNKKLIEYSSFEMFDSFMFEVNDDISLANKDLLLVDYLEMQYSIITTDKLDLGRRQILKIVLDNITAYLSKVYMYIFNLNTMDTADGLYRDFDKLNNKDLSIDSIANIKPTYLTEYELSLITILISYNSIASHNDKKNKLPEQILIKITELLILYVWKITKDSKMQVAFSKNVVELLSKSSETLERIYKNNLSNYAKFLIEFYTIFTIPINFDSLFKTYEIGNYSIIKSEEKYNFLKIILTKLIKNFSKSKFSLMLKIIVDEFKKRTTTQLSYFSYLIEIVWLLFRERNSKHIQFLPTVINLIMSTLDPLKQDLKAICLDNSKKVLSRLIVNYPMIAFHQNSQKVAVGSNDGKIFIYDMTSGNLWKNLPAHDNEISAISFDVTGNIIVSYSSSDHLVKCWKIGLTNFFSNFFTMKDGYYKQHKFSPIKDPISPEEKLKSIKFQLIPNKDNEIILIRENKSVEVLYI